MMLLPSLVEAQIRQGVADYLRTTFPITTPHFSRMLDDLIEGTGEVFKGSSKAANEDSSMHEDSSVTERSLLYVAMTRARKEVLVTWNGDMSPLLNNLNVGNQKKE